MSVNRLARCLIPAVTLGSTLFAQNAPGRPRLGGDADTNDAAAYFQWGLRRFESDPRRAGEAFYWAARLDPASQAAPQALYARYAALLMGDTRRLVTYIQREERTLSAPGMLALDSLLYHAEMQDPFVHRGLDEPLLFAYAQAARPRDEWFGRSQSGGETGMFRATEQFFEGGDPYSRGRMYYSRGQLQDALRYWAEALRNAQLDWVHAERARAWYELRQLDSAAAELRAAVDLARRGRGAAVRHVYESAASWETALGRVLEARRDIPGAREAYQQAVELDAAYFPARLKLTELVLASHDTATALMHLEQAVQSRAADFYTFATAGALASRAGRPDLAAAWLRRATEVEPLARVGWLAYARVLEASRDSGATAAFARFLTLAPRNDPDRDAVAQRLGRR